MLSEWLISKLTNFREYGLNAYFEVAENIWQIMTNIWKNGIRRLKLIAVFYVYKEFCRNIHKNRMHIKLVRYSKYYVLVPKIALLEYVYSISSANLFA